MIPGQPPSINHSYRPVKIPKKDRYGRTMWTPDGKPMMRIGLAKESGVEAYQTGAALVVRASMPSRWRHGGGWIRITYSFYLVRKVDCDNAMKALNDAVAKAIGVDDNWFLPCVISKQVNSKEPNPRIELTIDDQSDSGLPLVIPSTPSSGSRTTPTTG